MEEAARREIALDMWGNMARLGAEYIFLDQLFDLDPNAAEPGRVEVVGAERFLRLQDEKKPHILFTAHLGNFELLPVAAAAFNLDLAVMFRPPNNPYIADYVFSTRRSTMGKMLASTPGAAFALSRVLEAGGNIGVLVDQKFRGGLRTDFFGRECETSPLVARLARHFDCDVYPAHCIRLPGNRFRIELHEKLVLPRTDAGAIDVHRTTQLLTDVVEGWVRQTPGQWMWFHKRWEISGRWRKKRKTRATARNSS
jgi:KDO2-lipid IV(A) lauroyltransferase